MEVDKIKSLIGDVEKENIKKEIAIKKAVDFVTDNAKEK